MNQRVHSLEFRVLNNLQSKIKNAIENENIEILEEILNDFQELSRLSERREEEKKEKKLSSTQARKLLDMAKNMAKKIRKNDKTDIIREIVKMKVILDYQRKRKVLDENYWNLYSQALDSLMKKIKNNQTLDFEKVMDIFISIMEMLTVYLSKTKD